jgi:hypothetical protein
VAIRRSPGGTEPVSPDPPRLRTRSYETVAHGYSGAVQVVKSLWAVVQGDPVFMRRVNGWFTIAWIAMIPISYAMGWLNSVVYVSALSLWALVSGHWAAWQAARVEVAQENEIAAQARHPVEERVVERLTRDTDVERT